jgi:hypothetical protein
VGGIDINMIRSLIQTSLGIHKEKISSEITITEINGKITYLIRMRSSIENKLLVDFNSDKDIGKIVHIGVPAFIVISTSLIVYQNKIIG